MKDIVFENVVKKYDGDKAVLNSLNLKINDGERVVLLGPSGCGKSTTLRIIAGLSDITSGHLWMNGKIANDIEPKDRNISMVFQNYALYPHMSVKDNICYSLRVNKVPKEKIDKAFNEAISILKLNGLEDRKPKDLSGGQRQRVALGRALVKNSDYFLLDEPLSNLDAQLRLHARKELVRIHEKYNMTFIYVTHDQVEAMTIGQRIVLLNKGDIQMADTPDNIYNHPKNVFTAKFIGSPSMNIIEGQFQNPHILINEFKIKLSDRLIKLAENSKSKEILLGIRPEHIVLKKEEGLNTIKLRVDYEEDYGNRLGIYFSINNEEFVLITNDKGIKENDMINIEFPDEFIQLFDKASGENLEVLN